MPVGERALALTERRAGTVDDHSLTGHSLQRMRIAVLVKQVPKFEEMELGPDGRLRRDGIELEMNPYCRRAVSQAVALAAERTGTQVTVFTLGPPSAGDTLREAIAWGSESGVEIDGVLVTDPAFAGSDTLATAKALTAALTQVGPFDLLLAGRNSVDADTGQVPAEIAELLDVPFLTGVRELTIDARTVHARCEHDDGWMEAAVNLPAVLSCAERLIDPAKVDPADRALVDPARIRTISAADLGPGPWGQNASPTWVGTTKVMAVSRARTRWLDASLHEQVRNAVHVLAERNAFTTSTTYTPEPVAPSQSGAAAVMVVAEPGRAHETRELLGAAARLTGNVVLVTLEPPAATLMSWGADRIILIEGENIEEDVARAVVDLAAEHTPQIILASSTAWGREVAARVAARTDAGLTGDAVDLELGDDGQLIAWKPAFGGQLIAAIGYRWDPQLATVRAGVLPVYPPRPVSETVEPETRSLTPRGRVRVLARTRDDDLDLLAEAHTVLAVGQGVPPEEYGTLEPLRALLDAELGATRKVTDKGWLPRSRQIGLTGRAIAPRLLVSVGASGKFNHVIGVRAAGTVLAINPDPSALIFDASDVGIVGEWQAVVPLLVEALADRG